MLLLLAATTSLALENNNSDGTDIPQVPGTPNYITWAKYHIRIARNQVSILHEEVSVSVVSIIVVSYRPALVVGGLVGGLVEGPILMIRNSAGIYIS